MPTIFTRPAPRILDNSNNWQQVNDVRIYVFQENTDGDFVYYTPQRTNYFLVFDFDNTDCIYMGWIENKEEQHSYNVKQMQLPDGKYKFLVVGRDDKTMKEEDNFLTDPNTDDEDWTFLSAWEPGQTKLDDATLIGIKQTKIKSTELFSACSEAITVDAQHTGFTQTIEMKRSVAGLLVYIENVPTRKKALETISLGRGTKITEGEEHDVNYIKVLSREMLDRILLSDSHPYIKEDLVDSNEDAPLSGAYMEIIIPKDANSDRAYFTNTNPGTDYPNSLLGGAFIMPQPEKQKGAEDADMSHETLDKSLYLVLYSQVTEKYSGPIWRTPIKLVSSSNGKPISNEYYYSIDANSFYSLGCRKYGENGDLVEDIPLWSRLPPLSSCIPTCLSNRKRDTIPGSVCRSASPGNPQARNEAAGSSPQHPYGTLSFRYQIHKDCLCNNQF